MTRTETQAAPRDAEFGGTSSAIAAFSNELQHEAAAWRVPRQLALTLFLLPLVGAPLVALSFLDRPLFRFLTAEDRLLEWAQFVGYLGAAALAAVVAFSLARRGARVAITCIWALLALGCLGVAGEEISWGQRIFGWETPESLQAANLQEETNIHNIGTVQSLNNVALLVVGLYGSLAPFLVQRVRSARFYWLFVPPIFLTAAFFVVFAFKVGRFTVIPRYDAIVELGEWPEFCLALALSTYTVLVFLRLRRVR